MKKEMSLISQEAYEQTLKDIIKSGIVKSYQNSYRNESNIHASSLGTFCSRKYAILSDTNIKIPKKYLGINSLVTYSIGNKIQDIIHSSLGEKVYGMWVCSNCGKVLVGYNTIKTGCSKCGTNRFLKYKECSLEYSITPTIKVSGSIDIIVELGDKLVVLECKSIAPQYFEKLTEPQPNHTLQVQTYLWLIKKLKKMYTIADQITSDFALIIYVSKGHLNDPFKIFTINSYKEASKILKKASEDLTKFHETGKLPNRICLNEFSPLAKECGAVLSCFEIKSREFIQWNK